MWHKSSAPHELEKVASHRTERLIPPQYVDLLPSLSPPAGSAPSCMQNVTLKRHSKRVSAGVLHALVWYWAESLRWNKITWLLSFQNNDTPHRHLWSPRKSKDPTEYVHNILKRETATSFEVRWMFFFYCTGLKNTCCLQTNHVTEHIFWFVSPEMPQREWHTTVIHKVFKLRHYPPLLYIL